MASRASSLPPEEIKRRIEKALEVYGTHTWEDLCAELVRGDAQIFWNDHGAWITRINEFPRKRMLSVWIVAGKMPEVMDLLEKVEAHARSAGCTEITAVARKGWLSHKETFGSGWRNDTVVLRRKVECQ